MFIDSLKKISLQFWNNGAASIVDMNKSDWIVDTWYDITIVHTPTAIIAYVDGVLDTNSATAFTVGTNSLPVILGAEDASGTSGLNGKLDDVRFYERGLSLSEAQTIDNSGIGTEVTELFRETVVAKDLAKFNDGVISGATNTDGIDGLRPDAMFFDGVDDNVKLATNPNDILNLGGSYAISLDFNVVSSAATDGTLMGCRSDSGSNMNLIAANPNASTIRVSIKDSLGNFRTSAAVDYNPNVFNNFIMFYDKEVDFVFIYINGILKTSLDMVNGMFIANTAAGLFVGDNTFSTEPYKGKIQNVRVYNRILTDGEASKIARQRL